MRPLLRWLAAGLVVALSFAAGPMSSQDSPVIKRIVKSGELRVGMSGGQAPLNMKDKDGNLMGLEVDLARMLASSMNVDAKFVEMPFSELLDSIDKGKVDVVMSGMTITPARNMKVAFVGPYFVTGKSILTTSNALAAAKETGDINDADLRLVALEGSTSQIFVERVLPRSQLVKVPDYDTGLAKVKSGDASAMVADLHVCLLAVLRDRGAGLATLAEPLTIEPIGLAAPANDPLFINMLTNLFAAMQGTGVLDELQTKWFGNGAWLERMPDPAQTL